MRATPNPDPSHPSSTSGAEPRAGALPATRRDALHLLGGGIALVAVARVATPAAAQDASPAPVAGKEGLYAVLRTRTVKADASIDDLTAATREGVLPIVRAIPGFVEYYVIQNFDTRERTGVSIFTDKAGADESTRLVGEFIASEGIAEYYEDIEPVVVEGEIVTAAV